VFSALILIYIWEYHKVILQQPASRRT